MTGRPPIHAGEVDPTIIPPVLLVGAICGGIFAVVFGALGDRLGRRPVYLSIVGALVLLPVPTFLALNTGNTAIIYGTMIVSFILAAQGAVAVTMSYFPELFGSRYRYAGVTLGREIAAVLGGGVAPLICTALMSALYDSWIPVAGYMMLVMAIAFVAAWLAPETVDRDLTAVDNATDVAR